MAITRVIIDKGVVESGIV